MTEFSKSDEHNQFSKVSPQYPELAAELEQMLKEDQEVRMNPIYREEGQEALAQKLYEVTDRHTDRLSDIVEEYGWPTISMVGEAGSMGAFLIA